LEKKFRFSRLPLRTTPKAGRPSIQKIENIDLIREGASLLAALQVERKLHLEAKLTAHEYGSLFPHTHRLH
jgi:hypothetical protein